MRFLRGVKRCTKADKIRQEMEKGYDIIVISKQGKDTKRVDNLWTLSRLSVTSKVRATTRTRLSAKL